MYFRFFSSFSSFFYIDIGNFQIYIENDVINSHAHLTWGFLGGSAVKNSLAMQEMQVQSLGQKDPLEKEMVAHSSILAWKIPRTAEPVGSRPWGRKESDTTEQLHFHFHF